MEEAFLALGESTAEALCDTLEDGMGVPDVRLDRISWSEGMPGDVVTPDASSLLVSVGYTGEVAGANWCLVRLGAARRLVATMMGQAVDGTEDDVAPLDELESSAIAEAMNQMMASTAAVLGRWLERDVQITPPELDIVGTAVEVADRLDADDHVLRVELRCSDDAWCFLLVISRGTLIHVRRRLELAGEDRLAGAAGSAGSQTTIAALESGWSGSTIHGLAVDEVVVVVAAEFGRFTMPADELVALGAGVVVELEQRVDDPIEVHVNGTPFAAGSLIVTGDGHLAVEVAVVHT